MNIEIVKSNWELLCTLRNEFVGTLTGPVDGFWCNNITSATPYALMLDGQCVGFCAARPEWDGETALTAFYLQTPHLRAAQEAFERALEITGAHRVLASSADPLLLNLALERAVLRGLPIRMQAYNFDMAGTLPAPPPTVPEAGVHRLSAAEYPLMHSQTENDYAEMAEDARNVFYRFALDGRTVGYGCIAPTGLIPGLYDVGNHVLENARRKGVGRSIILHLARIVRETGGKPTCGCWYYNTASVQTLMSAGCAPLARIYNIETGK